MARWIITEFRPDEAPRAEATRGIPSLSLADLPDVSVPRPVANESLRSSTRMGSERSARSSGSFTLWTMTSFVG